MSEHNSLVATFANHSVAEATISKLHKSGLGKGNFPSSVGTGISLPVKWRALPSSAHWVNSTPNNPVASRRIT